MCFDRFRDGSVMTVSKKKPLYIGLTRLSTPSLTCWNLACFHSRCPFVREWLSLVISWRLLSLVQIYVYCLTVGVARLHWVREQRGVLVPGASIGANIYNLQPTRESR